MARYLVQEVKQAQSKKGFKYTTLTLVEPGGRPWKAFFPEQRDGLRAGMLVDALADKKVSAYSGEEELEVKALRVLAETVETDEFLPRAQVDVPALLRELKGFIASVTSAPLRGLLDQAVTAGGDRLLRAPAAQVMHHAYLGGLLHHVVSLCREGDRIAALHPEIRRDLLITAAVLHDWGKIHELAYDKLFEYTTLGKLIGHLVIGYTFAERWMDADPAAFGTYDRPTELRNLVRHLVLSHHGSKNFGSPVPPETLEAQVFSNLDGLDANIGAILAATERAGSKEWTDKTNTGNAIYLGGRT